MAVTALDFSENDDYLEMCVQRVTQDGVKENSKTEENLFLIWDVINNVSVNDLEKLKKTLWPEWCMANAIHARKVGLVIEEEN
jgi:uncharacterized protein with WD repeat